jgi:hypothetical protein
VAFLFFPSRIVLLETGYPLRLASKSRGHLISFLFSSLILITFQRLFSSNCISIDCVYVCLKDIFFSFLRTQEKERADNLVVSVSRVRFQN